MLGKKLKGRWRIVEMDQWDKKFIDLVEPGYIEFIDNGFGSKHLLECKKLKLLYIGASTEKLFNDIEIQPLYDLYNLKHIRFNGYGIVNYGKNVQDWLEYMEKYNKTEVIHIY